MDQEKESLMRIGIFQLLPQPPGSSSRQVIECALKEAVWVEDRGWDAVWTAEHHSSALGTASAPSVYCAALSQRTHRISIGYAVALPAMRHPLNLAEEFSWVDLLSKGRLIAGVGPGFSPEESAALGVDHDDRYQRMEEAIDFMRRAFEGQPFGFQGRFWQTPRTILKPAPERSLQPALRLAASSLQAVERAARLGLPPLLGPCSIEQTRERLRRYRRLRTAMGASAESIEEEVGRSAVLRRVLIAPDADQAEACVVEALASDSLRRAPSEQQPASPGAAGHEAAPNRLREAGAGIIAGDPQGVLAELRQLQDLGIGHLIAWMRFGNLRESTLRRSMQLMSDQVIPSLKREGRSLQAV